MGGLRRTRSDCLLTQTCIRFAEQGRTWNMTCWIHQSLLRLRLQDASLPMIRRTGLSAHAKEFTPLAAEIAPVSSVLTAGSDQQVADQLAEHHEHERNEGI